MHRHPVVGPIRPRILLGALGWTLSLAAAAVALGGCSRGDATAEAPREMPRNVRVLDLQTSAVEEFFEVSGPVSPLRGTDLAAEESGPVVAIPVAKGRTVSAGQVILEQDRTILAAEMAAAKGALAAQAYNCEKVQQLFDAGKVSRMELLNAEALRDQAQAQADVGAERWRRAAVRSPFAGIVVDRYVELGQFLAPGVPAVRVIDPYTLKLEAYLTDTQVPWVISGQPCRVVLGGQTAAAAGKVTWVSREADRSTGKFKLEIEIPNPDLAYSAGVIGRALLPRAAAGGIAVPRDAVLTGVAGATAFVVEQDRARLRNLRLGSDQGLLVAVIAGLQAGDRLVVRGQRELQDGSLVRITEVATAPDGSVPQDPQEVRATTAGPRLDAQPGPAEGKDPR